MIIRRLIVPVSFAVMALAVAAMLPALVSAQNTEPQTMPCHTFSVNLSIGSADPGEIGYLSAALVESGLLDREYDVFDEDVAAAVEEFQEMYGIPTTGYVGPLTRSRLNTLYGCSPESDSIVIYSSDNDRTEIATTESGTTRVSGGEAAVPAIFSPAITTRVLPGKACNVIATLAVGRVLDHVTCESPPPVIVVGIYSPRGG